MYKQFSIKNNIKPIQNLLINESIRDDSNIQLLKSEEAIRDVLKSYSDKFNATGDKLTNISKHYVEPKSLITTNQFNDLFQSLFIDLKALYEDLALIENILNMNLERNKKFFSVLKKRMRELWNKLDITRMNISDNSVFHESYFESFSNISSRHKYSNLLVDKKTGYIKLSPKVHIVQNKRYLIKSVTSKTFPVHNKDGGVIHTTNTLNTYEENYKNGTRDMLEDGLWKAQLFCNEIPEIKYDIIENSNSPMYKNVNGIISIIDIQYNYPIEMNNIEFDIFGEYPVTLLGIFTKNSLAENWIPVKKITTFLNSSNQFEEIDDFKSLSEFDILSVSNMELTRATYVRIAISQENYELLDSSELTNISMEDKINEDFSERRYNIVSLDSNKNDEPLKYTGSSTDSLYSKIVEIIESSRSIEGTLKDILDILEPPIKVNEIDFNKTLKYEIGMWSIEPTVKRYQGIGKFDSGDYTIPDKSLINVSLNTKQEDIRHNTCNWYISHPDYEINVPIIENNNIVRKEPAHIIRPEYYEDLGWTAGYLVQLDFPMNLSTMDYFRIYVDGQLIYLSNFTYYILNSTLLYIENIDDPYKKNYVVEYMPALYTSVSVYVMDKTTRYTSSSPSEYLVVSPRRSLLKYFINQNAMDNTYNVKKALCTRIEYDMYFPNNSNICMSSSINTTYMPISDNFKKNVVDNFRSVNYTSFSVGYVTNNIYGSANVPAVPTAIERTI